MNFFSKKHDYFALSFSDSLIQLAQADKKGRLRRFSERKLEPGIIERGEIKNPEVLRQVLSDFLKLAKLKPKFVVVGLPEVRSFTRAIRFPFLSDEELDDAVRWESESILPFPLEEAFLDWMVLEKTKDWVRVLAVALPRSLVEDYSKVLEELGFQPVAFETTSLSLARLVSQEKTTVLLVEAKEKEAVLVIVGPNGGIEVSSTITYGNINEATAEIKTTVGNLLNFYRKKIGEEKDERKIGKIEVCGSGAQPELVKTLGKEINLPCSILNIQKPELAVILSLARKNVAAPVDEKTINLIPPRIQGIYDQVSKVNEISLWLKISLFSLFLVLFAYCVAAANIYFEVKKIEGKIIELQAAVTPQFKETEKMADFLNQRSQKIISLGSSSSEVIKLFSLIRQSVTEGISVSGCSYNSDRKLIIVDGTASHRKELLSFREALENTQKFTQVRVPLSSLETETNIRFSIELTGKEGF